MPFIIGLENVKHRENVGSVMRSAYNFGAASVFTIGRRYQRQCTDTPNTSKQIPVMNYENWDDYRTHAFSWIHIGVELTNDAHSLLNFVHPPQCVYLLGPEDGSLSQKAQSICKYIVKIPSIQCLNLAMAGTVVMYDRISKMEKR